VHVLYGNDVTSAVGLCDDDPQPTLRSWNDSSHIRKWSSRRLWIHKRAIWNRWEL